MGEEAMEGKEADEGVAEGRHNLQTILAKEREDAFRHTKVFSLGAALHKVVKEVPGDSTSTWLLELAQWTEVGKSLFQPLPF